MLSYIAQRFFLGILTLFVLTAISWVIIELPPGDFVDMYVEELIGGNIGEGGGIIGVDAPAESEVWVPLDLQTGFDILIEEVIALASAGYPACAGCGGSDAETPWDELAIRELYY